MNLPPIPANVVGLSGAICVELCESIRARGTEYWGEYDRSERRIRLDRAAPLEWQTNRLYHEMAHATLDDSGLHNLLSEKVQEALCDAFASARMAELRARLLVDQSSPAMW